MRVTLTSQQSDCFLKKENSFKERVQYKPSYGLTSSELVNLLFVGLHVVLFGVKRTTNMSVKKWGRRGRRE